MNSILLEVLVPAYEYSEGITRILDALQHAPPDLVHCVISDDSSSDVVEQAVRKHPMGTQVSYRRNRPAQGAIANWNNLLAQARGHYVMILHHDEWPLEEDFFQRACDALRDGMDILVLDCVIGSTDRTTMRPHMPVTFKRLALNFFPGYLLRRNLLGAPSVFVLRRSIALPFDIRISWLVDVEWYVRHLRLPDLKIHACSYPRLLSLPHSQSITASLGSSLDTRKRLESDLLRQDQPDEWALYLNAPQSILHKAMSIFEAASWILVKACIRTWHIFKQQSVPASLRKASQP